MSNEINVREIPDSEAQAIIAEAYARGCDLIKCKWVPVWMNEHWVTMLGLCDIIAELRKAKQ